MNASRLPALAFGAALLLPASVRSHGLWIEPGTGDCKVYLGEPEHGLREKQDKGRFLTLKAWKADGAEIKPELKEDHILLPGGSGGDCTAANLDAPVRESKEGMGEREAGPWRSSPPTAGAGGWRRAKTERWRSPRPGPGCIS